MTRMWGRRSRKSETTFRSGELRSSNGKESKERGRGRRVEVGGNLRGQRSGNLVG